MWTFLLMYFPIFWRNGSKYCIRYVLKKILHIPTEGLQEYLTSVFSCLRARWIWQNTVVYCQMPVSLYWSNSGRIPFVYYRIYNVFPYSFRILFRILRSYIFSGSIIVSRIPVSDGNVVLIQWHFSRTSVYSIEYFLFQIQW